MKRICILAFALLIHINALCATANDKYIFEIPAQGSGFTFGQIASIATDKNNMPWFACDNGLYYYNSKEFKHYSFNPNAPGSLPSNTVLSLLNDSTDRLWVVTNNGICYYNSENDSFTTIDTNVAETSYASSLTEYKPGYFLIIISNKLFSFSYEDPSQLNIINTEVNAGVNAIFCNDNGTIYIGHTDGSLYTTNSSLKEFKLLSNRKKGVITSICEYDQQIYIGYKKNGIDVINTNGVIVKRYHDQAKRAEFKISHNDVKTIIKRAGGDIWVGTGSGLNIISEGKVDMVMAQFYNQLPRNGIYSLHIDQNNAVWIGTWAGRIAYYNDSNYRFKHSLKENPDIYSHHVGLVHHFAPNDKTTTWVGDEWNGISLYNHTNNKYTKNYKPGLRIKSLHKDNNNNLWIGTVFQGLYKMNTDQRQVNEVDVPELFKSESVISAITTNPDGSILWVGSRDYGILRYNTISKEWQIFDYRNTKGMVSNHIWALQVIDNQLIICSDAGFTIMNTDSEEFKTYEFGDLPSYDNCSYSMCYDERNNDIYIGSKAHGIKVFNLGSYQYKPFAQNDVLKQYRIYNILMDHNSLLWFSTNNGVYQYSLDSGKMNHFTESDGLNSLQFHPASCAITPDNNVIFGSTNGFYYINADQIKTNDITPRTFISDIYINNEKISEDDYRYINSLHTTDIKKIKLSHRNNTVTFEIASDNMLKPKNCYFEYRLQGYQNNWVRLNANQNISFTKLPFGRYTLELKSCNNDGLWGDVTEVEIIICAPIYLKWYAILLYIIITIAIIIFAIRETEFKIKAKKDIEFERQINIINSTTFDEKIKFFMNISHELRTPLTLIKAPLGVLEREMTTKDGQIHVNAIKRNTDRLLRLTNQILDFRLLEVGKLKKSVSKCNVTELCVETYSFFEYLIADQEINFTFEAPSHAVIACLDNDMIGKVIYNILANSFKYSNDGASISLKLKCCDNADRNIDHDIIKGTPVDGSAIIITIEDSGIGIAQNRLEHIFERFFYNTNEAYSSSGIGLHLCMEYINLHNGCIYVSSKENIGTKFTIVIPSQMEQTEATDLQSEVITTTPYIATKEPIEEVSNNKKNHHKSTILIVDDNPEIRFYLKKILGQSYNCITAKNGQQGYDLAIDVKPNLIILDVLMPIMGGIDCTLKLKENPVTKLIPIIMLTSLSDENKIIQGVKAGADAYLSKPIDEAILFAHIERLLERNTNTKQQTHSDISIEPKSSKKDSNNSFTKTIEQIMEQNIQNSMLDVNLIAQHLQISRSTLQRSFKSEIDMGVAEYIRDYRLRSAIKLMESGVYNIDELSTCVGFNSSSYFCKAFKDKYGMSPKKYCDSLKLK